ncbi:MAG: hypothetical protein ACKODK_10130 [Opitutaceae bacterium]
MEEAIRSRKRRNFKGTAHFSVKPAPHRIPPFVNPNVFAAISWLAAKRRKRRKPELEQKTGKFGEDRDPFLIREIRVTAAETRVFFGTIPVGHASVLGICAI